MFTYFDGCLTKYIPVGLNFKRGHLKLEYNFDSEKEIKLFLVEIVKQEREFITVFPHIVSAETNLF